MKIRDSIVSLLLDMNGKVLLDKETITEEKRHEDSPFNQSLTINNIKKVVNCSWCEKDNTNWCWNCEKPHCDDHARAIFFPSIHIINTLCLECSEELEKLLKSA